MNCFYHFEKQVVAQCSICGKGLCSYCAPQISPPTCTTCYNNEVKSARATVIKELLVTYGVGIILTFFLMRANIWGFDFSFRHINVYTSFVLMTIVTLYVISGIVSGWKTLTAITPPVFLFMPIVGWVLYFLVKFVLAFFVGLVMLPIRTVVCIVRLNRLKTIK